MTVGQAKIKTVGRDLASRPLLVSEIARVTSDRVIRPADPALLFSSRVAAVDCGSELAGYLGFY